MIRIIAVVGGVFLLMGHNWARWLMLAWLAFHVAVSAFHSLSEFIAACSAVDDSRLRPIGPPTSKYFQSAPSDYTGV